MRLFLVRHGQTAANVRFELDTGAPGLPLTEVGHEQAASLPDRFSGMQIDHIITSNLTRTQETARPLVASRGLEPVIDEAVREIQAGDLEMRSDMEAIRIYRDTVEAWTNADLSPRMPGAEDGYEVMGRFDGAVDRVRSLVGAAGTVAIFAHGAIIRTWSKLRSINGGDERFALVENTGIVELHDGGGQWRINAWLGELDSVS